MAGCDGVGRVGEPLDEHPACVRGDLDVALPGPYVSDLLAGAYLGALDEAVRRGERTCGGGHRHVELRGRLVGGGEPNAARSAGLIPARSQASTASLGSANVAQRNTVWPACQM